MRYHDGQIARLGDEVDLAGNAGKAVCSIDTDEYSDAYKKEHWSYLRKGVVIEFEAFGLIHYELPETDLTFVRRRGSV